MPASLHRPPVALRALATLCLSLALAATPAAAGAQLAFGPGIGVAAAGQPAVRDTVAPRRPKRMAPIYESPAPLAVSIQAELDSLRGDRTDGVPWRPATVAWTDERGERMERQLRVRTRGASRRAQCDMPPLRLNFVKDSVRGTALARLDEPKLVLPCKDDDLFERYVLQEHQLYRVHQLLDPNAHRTRLLRLTLVDAYTGHARDTRWAFLLEEGDEIAKRLGAERVERRGALPSELDVERTTVHALFQYLIGNTDWSVAALHNIELLRLNDALVPVGYDFDLAGAVDAAYARGSADLGLRSVRERRYRGSCLGNAHLPAAIALFNERKDAIYALYRDEVGRLLDRRTVGKTLRYFDEFYRTINDPAAVQRELVGRCLDDQ